MKSWDWLEIWHGNGATDTTSMYYDYGSMIYEDAIAWFGQMDSRWRLHMDGVQYLGERCYHCYSNLDWY